MQSITSGQTVSSPIEIKGTASLKNGQILFGKVNKVFPNQTAEVQIGHQKMIATLDIPLRTGEKSGIPENSAIDKLHQGLQLLSEGKKRSICKS
ncbi:hypothetical protein [Peribacillus sp. V2I11]|uniref:hypothetical protein n=1 Tax=Peribacillus sp. V2I11 TaxID=3042277 RepID=UPI002788EE01|nr:hypothetical protein [Peribacillus sp. V2I11]MDQ0879602.1 hypothetical protein [Peribacillus sp. V2I11]